MSQDVQIQSPVAFFLYLGGPESIAVNWVPIGDDIYVNGEWLGDLVAVNGVDIEYTLPAKTPTVPVGLWEFPPQGEFDIAVNSHPLPCDTIYVNGAPLWGDVIEINHKAPDAPAVEIQVPVGQPAPVDGSAMGVPIAAQGTPPVSICEPKVPEPVEEPIPVAIQSGVGRLPQTSPDLGLAIFAQPSPPITILGERPLPAPIPVPRPNQPQQLTTQNAIQGVIDGINANFTSAVAFRRAQIWKNGVLMIQNVDCCAANQSIVFLTPQIPQPGDVLKIEAWT